MHSLYFVMFEKERATSAGIAGWVADTILIDEGFCNQGYFGAGRSDRYEIGWRWKGLFEKLFNPDISFHNLPPITENAILITDAVRLKLNEFRPDVEIFDADEYIEFNVSDLSSKHNNKWFVIIDYHH